MAKMTGTIDNKLLVMARTKSEESVPKEFTRGYHQIVAAGLKAMFAEKTFPLMKEYLGMIKAPTDIPKLVSHGIIKLLSLVSNASQGKIQIEASGSAAITLMTHALDYVEDVMKIPITKDLLAETTQLTNQGLMTFLKQSSGMSDQDFDMILQGRGKELVDSKQASQGAQPGAAALPGTGALPGTEDPTQSTMPSPPGAGMGAV